MLAIFRYTALGVLTFLVVMVALFLLLSGEGCDRIGNEGRPNCIVPR